LALAILGTFVALRPALDRIGGGPLATTDATGGAGTSALADHAASRAWVVRPGDTLWRIAEALDPHGDVRPLVDRLSVQVGGAPLHPGQVIQIPSRA
jgi:nucleoid-associated protein YgaU